MWAVRVAEAVTMVPKSTRAGAFCPCCDAPLFVLCPACGGNISIFVLSERVRFQCDRCDRVGWYSREAPVEVEAEVDDEDEDEFDAW